MSQQINLYVVAPTLANGTATCGVMYPDADRLLAAGVAIAPCSLDAHHRGPCHFDTQGLPQRRLIAITDAAGRAGLLGTVEPTEANPRGVAVHHKPGDDRPHACAPNIFVTCAGCLGDFVLCTMTPDEYMAIRARAWRCSQCGVTFR